MRVTFWGVRGSAPAPGRDTWRYGGNTPCLEVRADEQLFIFDAGTGIRDLGHQLCAELASPGLQATLFLSHYHWDHVQGLPFFEPLYFAGNHISICGPRPQADAPSSLPGVLHVLFRPPFFPVSTSELKSTFALRELDWKSDFTSGTARIRTCRTNHPQGALAYRVDNGGASLVYATDHEPGNPDLDRDLRALARGSDLLINDAQYRPEQLGAQKAGWGHGSWLAAATLAREAGAKNLVLFHHEPLHSDHELDAIVHQARQVFPNTWGAAEGMYVDVTRKRISLGSRANRLSQRAPAHFPARLETTLDGNPHQEEVRLQNLSFQGAYFLTLQHYEPQQTVHLALPCRANGNGHARENPHDHSTPEENEFRLRGYVLRTEPLTTNGGWVGVAVHFPGRLPAPRPAVAQPAARSPLEGD